MRRVWSSMTLYEAKKRTLSIKDFLEEKLIRLIVFCFSLIPRFKENQTVTFFSERKNEEKFDLSLPTVKINLFDGYRYLYPDYRFLGIQFSRASTETDLFRAPRCPTGSWTPPAPSPPGPPRSWGARRSTGPGRPRPRPRTASALAPTRVNLRWVLLQRFNLWSLKWVLKSLPYSVVILEKT